MLDNVGGTSNLPDRIIGTGSGLSAQDVRDRWDRLKRLVLDAVTSEHSKRAYAGALDDFFGWWDGQGRPVFNKATVQAFRAHLEARRLTPSTINVKLSAVRKLAAESADNGLLSPELASGISQVRGAKRHGVRQGNWLTLEQAQKLLRAPDVSTVKGTRDRAILAVLLGCALRRSEIAEITVEDLQQRDGRWVFADIIGKGSRVRTVPVPAWVKVAVDAWLTKAGITTGHLFRAVNKGGRIWGEGLTEKVIWQVLEQRSDSCGLSAAPHDLRRTCARLCRAAGGELEQIQFLLGHASIQTTERYLGSRQDLTHAPNDRIGLKLVNEN